MVVRNRDMPASGWRLSRGARVALRIPVYDKPEKSGSRPGVGSPDGRWLACQSEETGRAEVYVRPYPGTGGRVSISLQGGALSRRGRGTARSSSTARRQPDGGYRPAGREVRRGGKRVNLSTFTVPDGRIEQFLVEPAS